MIAPNIFQPRNDWNVSSFRSKKYNSGALEFEIKPAYEPALLTILIDVCKRERVSFDAVMNGSRNREYTEARQIYYKRAREITGQSFKSIGNIVGKDHATVIYGVSVVETVKEIRDRYNMYFNNHKSLIKPQ